MSSLDTGLATYGNSTACSSFEETSEAFGTILATQSVSCKYCFGPACALLGVYKWRVVSGSILYQSHSLAYHQLCMSYMLVCTVWLAVAVWLYPTWAASVLLSHTEGLVPCASLHIIAGATQHEDAGRNSDSPLHKKQRHVWTSEAHHEFSIIVKALGDSK